MSQTGQATVPTSIKHVVIASAVGPILEWYDFFIYGTASALVFGQQFFANYDPAVGTLAAFATFRRRVLGAAVRWAVFWPFWRPLGPEADANRDSRIGRWRHLPDRTATRLRDHRHLGTYSAAVPPPCAGLRRRRGVRRRGHIRRRIRSARQARMVRRL